MNVREKKKIPKIHKNYSCWLTRWSSGTLNGFCLISSDDICASSGWGACACCNGSTLIALCWTKIIFFSFIGNFVDAKKSKFEKKKRAKIEIEKQNQTINNNKIIIIKQTNNLIEFTDQQSSRWSTTTLFSRRIQTRKLQLILEHHHHLQYYIYKKNVKFEEWKIKKIYLKHFLF